MRSVSVLVAMLVLCALTIWAYRRHIFDSALGLDAAQTKDAMSAQNCLFPTRAMRSVGRFRPLLTAFGLPINCGS